MTRDEILNRLEAKFKTVYPNSYRMVKTLEEVNDFPTICFVMKDEQRGYLSDNTRMGIINLVIRGYAHGGLEAAEELAQKLEELFEAFSQEECFDARFITVSTDEGLMEPYAILDITGSIFYEVTK